MTYPIQEKLIQLIGSRLSETEMAYLNELTEEANTNLEDALREKNFEDFVFRMSTEIGIFSFPLIESAYEELTKALSLEQPSSRPPSPPASPALTAVTAHDGQEALNQQANVKRFIDKLKVSREGQEARIPAILSRGGAAEGLLKREHYMLTQTQVNFVRKLQLEAVFNSMRSQQVRDKLARGETDVQSLPGTVSKATGIEISHRTHPAIFNQDDPRILIGEKGEVIMLCEQAKLGEGASGAVYIGQELDTGVFCVIKDYIVVDDQKRVEFNSENKTLDELNLLIDTLNTTALGSDKLMSAQELAWGENLCVFLGVEEGKQNEHSLLKREEICIKALEAIYEMNKVNKKLHRDIKVENVVWDDKTRTIKLVDVGFTVDMNNKGKFIEDSSPVGTPAYIAPELLRQMILGDDCVYSELTETYAAGMLACEIFSTDDLAMQARELIPNIQGKRGNFLKSGLTNMLAGADIFNEDPSGQRTRTEQNFYNEIAKLLEIDTFYRAKISDVLVNLKALHEQHLIELAAAPTEAAVTDPSKETAMPTEPQSNESSERSLSALLSTSIADINEAAKEALLELNDSKGFKGKLILSSSRTSSVDRSSMEMFIEVLDSIDTKSAITKTEISDICDALIAMKVAHQKQELEGKRFSSDKRVDAFIESTTERVKSLCQNTNEYKVGSEILLERAHRKDSKKHDANYERKVQ